MSQKADHPHQAAVHLMKALKCCQQCSQVNEIGLIELRQLQYRKNILAQELHQISIRGQSILALENQILQLDELIIRFQDENDLMEQQGLHRIEMAVEERKTFQNQQMATIITQLELQIQTHHQLKLEMEGLMQKIRQLNRINDELVFKFTNV